MIPVTPFRLGIDTLERLWKRFDANRAMFSDELPTSETAFALWTCSDSTKMFDVGPPDDPVGIFIFCDVVAGESAWSHLFIWDRERYSYREIVEAAQMTCRAMFDAFRLARINGLTPCSNVRARAFAEAVGFKIEGTLRDAVSVGGHREKAWISGLLPSDLIAHEKMDQVREEAIS